MRLLNHEGRAAVLLEDRVVDLERRSSGRFDSDVMRAVRAHAAVKDWADGASASSEDPALDASKLGPCVPRPSQVFGIGMNYQDHAEEAGLDIPKSPVIFTKFPSCLSGARAEVPLTSSRVDWEVELVVVIGRGGRSISEADALDHVAGYCVGQDLSDRRRQFGDKPPQFSLGKSAAGFGPIGPALVTLDELSDPLDLRLTCDVGDERVQDSRTSRMIFSVPALVAYLSTWCELAPGDLIFTGTPAGVGSTRDPRRYLAPGDVITSEIESLGRLINRCVSKEAHTRSPA